MSKEGMLLAENANSKKFSEKQYINISKLDLKEIESIHLYILVKIYSKMVFFGKQADFINAKNIKVNKRAFKKAVEIGRRNLVFITEKTNNFKAININKKNNVKIPIWMAYFLIKYTNKKLPGKYYAYFMLFYLIAQDLNLSKKRYFCLTINEVQERVKIRKQTICNFFNSFFPYYSSKGINLSVLYNAFLKYQNEVINYNPNPADHTKPKPKTKITNDITNNIANTNYNEKESIMQGKESIEVIEKHNNNTKPDNTKPDLNDNNDNTKPDANIVNIMDGIRNKNKLNAKPTYRNRKEELYLANLFISQKFL